jgi:hypothetical protein
MPHSPPEPQLLELTERGHYTLPAGLRFAGLGHSRSTGIFRVHLALEDGAQLEIPLSAQALEALIDELVPLARIKYNDLGEALEYIRRRTGLTRGN